MRYATNAGLSVVVACVVHRQPVRDLAGRFYRSSSHSRRRAREHGVGVHDRSEVTSGRGSITWLGFAIRGRTADLYGDLLVQQR